LQVVSGAAAEVEHALARHEIEMVEEIGPKAWLPIVDPASFVECAPPTLPSP
jgi:hypothetical protein